MTNAAARQETAPSVEWESAQYALSTRQIGYLGKIRGLQSEYEKSAGFFQKPLFVKMIHCFMQDLCGYPPDAYLVTIAAYGDDTVGSLPHIVPVAYYANPTLFWFTISEDADDVQDLWVKQAQVYLDQPGKGDAARDCATNIVFSNFFVVDGARKNIKNDAWNLWSASDVRGGRIARIDLRVLEKDEDLDPATSAVIEKRLRSLNYQAPPDVTKAIRKGHEALAELMRKAGHDSMAYRAKVKRGEGPLDLPIYGIDQITANERTRKATSLLQTEVFRFHVGTSALISRNVSYKSKPSVDQNLLICGDNLEVMQRLLDEHGSFLDLVYIDPPFCSNKHYELCAIGDRGKAFSDIWERGLQTYLPWLSERLLAIRSLLKDTGTLCIHLDLHAVHYLKAELDKIFGATNFANQVTWQREVVRGMKVHAKFMGRNTDHILIYNKDASKAVWNKIEGEDIYTDEQAAKQFKRDGVGYFSTSHRGTYSDESIITLAKNNRVYVTSGGQLIIKQEKLTTSKGTIRIKYYLERRGNVWVKKRTIDNLWTDIAGIASCPSERISGYPTQKPEALIKRFVLSCSSESATIADFFCGSGTTMAVAQKLGRRWIGVDQNPQAIEVAADRIRRISRQKDKAVGIEIPDLTVATSRGYSKFYASHYHREDVLTIDDTHKGNSLSEFQQFILDCYLPRDGRKGDATLHGFRTENGKEIAVFVGPNRRETKQTDVVQFLESVGRKAKRVNKVEILGWSFSPKLLMTLDQIVEAHGLNIELKKIHIVRLRIEDALKAKNVRFLAAARATIDMGRSGASLSCTLNLLSPVSEVRDIHWFIYPDASTDLEKIEYNFIKDDEEAPEDETQDDFEEASTETFDLKRHLKSLELKHTFKGIQDGEYRIYARVTDRRGHPTAIIEDIKVEGKNVSSLSESIESSEKEAA